MDFSNADGWIEIPAGNYQIGLDKEEAEEFWAAILSSHGPNPFGSKEVMPPALLAAIPCQTVNVSNFRISLMAVPVQGITFREANSIAKRNGYSLPTECEWEIAERYGPKVLSSPGCDEWCLDFFDAIRPEFHNAHNPVLELQRRMPFGSPRGRHVIRGQGIEFYHPAMRFHGAIGNRPYRTTSFRFVERERPLTRVSS